MGRIRALDGLRAFAVGVVMMMHAFWWVPGGFLGVDVFFVLSGYLITSLLLAERRRTGRTHFAGFYRRRVARLAPAYLTMIVLVTPILIWGPLKGSLEVPVWQAIGATAVYMANWLAAFNINALGPIDHTWSLSIEEQFYLGWPLTFFLLTRSRRSLIRWLGAALIVVNVCRSLGFLLIHHQVWYYVTTFTHSDGLLIGCMVAVLLARRTPDDHPFDVRASEWLASLNRWSGVLAGLGVAFLVMMLPVLTVYSKFTNLGFLFLAVGATAVIVWHLMTHTTGRLAAVLGWAPLAFIGRISYGLYLYHMPTFALVQHYRLGFFPTLSLEVGGTFALATVSWFCLERPVQRYVHHRWPRRDVTGTQNPLDVPVGAVTSGRHLADRDAAASPAA
jgi:peptidoglycan/LPS O-acetylase OafA/YrhL